MGVCHLMKAPWNWIQLNWISGISMQWRYFSFSFSLHDDSNLSPYLVMAKTKITIYLTICPFLDTLLFWPWLVMIIHVVREYFFQCVFPRWTEIDKYFVSIDWYTLFQCDPWPSRLQLFAVMDMSSDSFYRFKGKIPFLRLTVISGWTFPTLNSGHFWLWVRFRLFIDSLKSIQKNQTLEC